MKITINKSEKEGFALKLESGHFSGTLDEISRASLEDLKNSLESLLSNAPAYKIVWNPRSKRHELVPDE